MADQGAIRNAILRQVEARGAEKTICPSDVARSLSPDDWRGQMPQIREMADELAAEGRVVVTQKGREISAVQAKGPIRLGLPKSKSSQ